GQHYYFMDNETYDQLALPTDQVGDVTDFLVDNLDVIVAFHGSDPVEVRVPQHMNLKVVETEPGVRGDTATGGSKPAMLETGVVIQVPLFVEEGDTIRIDTRERRYIERVKG
ncbi:MAG: elongation factor P, partial [Candidatus Neomarinimicrobiota bacterium]